MPGGSPYTQSRAVTARQITFLSGDKTKAQQGKVVYVDGVHLQYDKPTNIYYVIIPVNNNGVKVNENYWLVTDNATGFTTVWDPTTFAAQHV
jgi:hypothetical protein